MKKICYFFLITLFITPLFSQETKTLTLEDAIYGWYKGLYPENLINLQWSKTEDLFLYRQNGKMIIQNPEGKIIYQLSSQDFPNKKQLPHIEIFANEQLIFRQDSSYVFYNLKTKTSQAVSFPSNAENIEVEWKKRQVAYTLENNLYIANDLKKKLPVAVHENKNIVSGQAIARSEFGITKGIFWSPSGNKLAFYQKDESAVDEYPLVDITQTPAKLKAIKYPMNGRGSEEPAVGIYDVQTNKTLYLQLFDKAGKFHYVTNLSWDPNEKYIFLAEVNRDQNHMWFNKYSAETGKFIKTLFEETNDKWVEPEHPAYFVPHTRHFIWLSERDGFMNLYLYHADSGKLLRQLTANKWVAKNIIGFSPDGKYVYFTGTGKDPRDTKFFQVKIKTGYQKELTKSNGTHQIALSPSTHYFIDNFSSIDIPRLINLYATNRKKPLKELLKSGNPLKEYGLPKPEMISLRGEFTDLLYGRIIKPSHFDPSKKYPVLVYVYGGPHVQLVTNSWMAGASLWMYWLAEQGYIIFTLDNHGSMNRGFAFESVIHRQLGQVEAKDQMYGIAYLRTLPYVDPNRIAVHGWSFGGYMTLTLMTEYPDVFKVGVAGGPVTDWKWYEVMYGERYMDTYKQNPDGFKKTSILNKIQNLQGKLLTIHGYMDDVVVPQHNIALHNEAIKKNIQMDFYLYPVDKHGVAGKRRLHLYRKMLDYIIRNNQ